MLLKKSLEGAIKTKEKPPMKGAVSRVKPLQSWVRFDYMAYRAVTSCEDRYKEKKISPSDCANFPFPFMSCQVTCCPFTVFVKL